VTEGLPGLSGHIRTEPEDFLVEEVPLYRPEGVGDHVLFTLEKRGISTFESLLWLSKAVKVSEHKIGYAGLKDARAVTRQTMSVHRVPPARLLAVSHPCMRVLDAARHPTRVRIGHLLGNRFTIRIRGANLAHLDAAREALAVLVRRGVPNAYGVQRFGDWPRGLTPTNVVVLGVAVSAAMAIYGGGALLCKLEGVEQVAGGLTRRLRRVFGRR